MADLPGLLETQLARALRALDLAATVAEAIKARPLKNMDQARVREAARRVQAVRTALLEAGVKLPPLRRLGQHDRKFGLGAGHEDALP